MIPSTIDSYRRQAVETASAEQLVLMLYDGAIDAVSVARAAAGLTDGREAMHRALVKAQDIVTELRCSLDHERGGAIAANLDALYEFCFHRLVEANLAKDAAALEGVGETLRGLRESWAMACCAAPVPA